MDEPPKRRLRPEQRRRVIEDAAATLFADRGYSGARLEDIAARAGITKQLLYRHFPDKTALYVALLERHRDDLDSFAAVIPTTGTLEQRLRAVVDVWLDYVQAHAYPWKLLFRDSGGGPEIQAFRVEVHARAREVLVGLIRSLGIAPIPQRELEPLAELLSMGQAAVALWWIDDPTVSRDAILDAIVRVWHGVLTSSDVRAQEGAGSQSGSDPAPRSRRPARRQ
jgi:AcrR family transcriptional regulator